VILAGIAILMGSLVMFAFPAVFFVIIETVFIPVEEKNLERIFGKEYDDYQNKVRRWL
jgi:protein-S-isoprenylcysteine O-methyltransferase Ste14